MSTLSLSSALLTMGTTAIGAGAAWLFTARHYRVQLSALGSHFEQAERAKQKAQELALQARQQVETLQLALSETKRDGAIQNAAASARAAAAAAEAAKAAQVKARAELMRQLEANDAKDDRSAEGFADTQPLH